jgi:GT2 family glycosyltransferase
VLFYLEAEKTGLVYNRHQPEWRSHLFGNVTVSIVLYHHGLAEVRSLFEALANDEGLSECVVVNNGCSDEACKFAASLGFQCIQPGRNLGFGSAHNMALRELRSKTAPYHLILNPDISLETGTLSELARVMDTAPQVGILMPRVLYPDGSTQYLCKLLPTPVDLFLRRFAIGPARRLFEKRMLRYDMKQFDYSRPVYVPVLSGCFMLTRRAVIDSIGGFDERFFLYMEDTDLCRRAGDSSRLLFWPRITVVHRHAQGSYKSLYLLRLHIRSAIAYFNKWGWLRDPVRTARNDNGLEDAANQRFRE